MAAVAFVLPLAAAAPAHAMSAELSSSTVSVLEPATAADTAGAGLTVKPVCQVGETNQVSFPVTLSPGSASARADYDEAPQPASVTLSCTLGFPGQAQAVGALVRGDNLDETDETFTLSVAAQSATITIVDSDPTPLATVADAAATTEGTGAGTTLMTFAVGLSGASSRAVTIPYTVAAGTATPGTDFDGTGGTVTIPAGQTAGTVSVPIVRDALNEPNETLTVSLGAPTNGYPQLGGKTTATGTILDDDSISFSIVANPSVTEGNSGTTPVTFTVRKTGQTTQTATVHVKTRDGSAGAPTDYQALADTTLTFAPGDTEKTVTVLVNGDTTVEGDEVFGLDLFNPSLGSVTTATATATIRNDDTPPAPPVKPPVTTPVTNPGTTPVTPVTPVTGGSASASTPKVTFKPLSFSKKQRRLTVTVTCPVSEKTCRVQLTVFTVKSAKSKVKQLRSERKLGSRIVIVPGGRTASITITLSRTNAKLLKRAKKIPVRAYAVVTDNDGNVGTSSKAGTLRG